MLVDDEELARQELRKSLSGEKDLNLIGEATNGLEAVELINDLRPDLVFLDIEMPGLNGFEVINSITHYPTIVFTTAYDHYALRAFEVNAVDYLLKPLSASRVETSLSRVRRLVRERNQSQADVLQQLVQTLHRGRPNSITRIAVQRGRHVVLVNLRDITHIAVEDKLVCVYTQAGRFLINRTLSDLEEMLSSDGFFRINRSTIINLDCLAEIIPWFSGTCQLKLANGKEMTVSRDRVNDLKRAVGLSKNNQLAL